MTDDAKHVDDLCLRAIRIADETMMELVASEALHVPGTRGMWQLCDDESKPVLRLTDASAPLIDAARWLVDRGWCYVFESEDGAKIMMIPDRPNNADAADCGSDLPPGKVPTPRPWPDAPKALRSWIDAASELPDDGRTVLIACAANSEPVWLGYHDAGHWLSIDGFGIDDVTHWQDLPDPPQEEVKS